MAISASPVQEEPLAGKHFRNQLAAAVRSINWSYAMFWSISSRHPGVLTWDDGSYNGEVKTRKIANSTDLTADQLVLQRSEQLRELYESLLSSGSDQPARRPVAWLSPEDLGDTEWYYMVCMSYAFRPGQGLPGKSFATNECIWLCNAQFADSKTFPRALLAKSASIQTVVCVPFMAGVLEFGTTDPVLEDQDLVNQTTASFWELEIPICLEEPISSPSVTAREEGDIVFENLDHNMIETIISDQEQHDQAGKFACPATPFALHADSSGEQTAKEIDEFYSICDEFDIQSLEDTWMDGSSVVPSSPDGARSTLVGILSSLDSSRASNFTVWKGSDSDISPPVITGAPQNLLKKVVAGAAWTSNSGSTTRTQENSIKNHVMSERRRREKLNKMFVILKSLVPSIHKVDKASILAETIAYLKELEQRVEELKSSRKLSQSHPMETRGRRRDNMGGNKVSASKRKASEICGAEREHHWVLARDGPSNINVTIIDKEVKLEMHCQWKEFLMARVFDAIKSLHLDVLSVQASTPDGLLGLKIRAKFASSTVAAPGMVTEAIRRAVSKC